MADTATPEIPTNDPLLAQIARAADKETIIDLQAALAEARRQRAAVQPLVALHAELMTGRRAFVPLAEWMRFEVVVPMRGGGLEDVGAADDWLHRDGE